MPLIHTRFAAVAALAASLAGCSFSDSGERSARYQEIDGTGAAQVTQTAQAAQSVQPATLPGHLSNEDIVPARPVGSAPGLLRAVPRKLSGSVGFPSGRPEPAVAAVPVLVSPPRRALTFADLVPPRPLWELKPMGTPLRAVSHTLADLVEDQAWRKRTSQRLERLFQQ